MHVEAGRVGQDGVRGEDGKGIIGLLGGGEDAEDALAAGYRDALALELRDQVGAALAGRLVEAWDRRHDGIQSVGREAGYERWLLLLSFCQGLVNGESGGGTSVVLLQVFKQQSLRGSPQRLPRSHSRHAAID